MVTRKNMGKGQGKGYKNIQMGRDPKVHSDSAKGMKQPQNLPENFRANLVSTKADDPVTEIQFDPTVEGEEVKKESFLSKTKGVAVKGAKATGSFASKQLQKRKEAKEKEKIEELESVHHPVAKNLLKQRDRVDTLKTQISETTDEKMEEKLFDELAREQEQLRKAQEKLTELDVVDMSDRELKTLAIRHKGGFFGGNKFTNELKRRITAEKKIEKELADERKKPVEEGNFFGF